MKKENLLLSLLVLLLLVAMIFTVLAGGKRSRHGYGIVPAGSILQSLVA